ncbi:hypothetical protein GDO78_013939 [Eleutherodactylus coqui]|uniref:Uncharacterized protein n=1 Tax=Eleutherodactylus coqui TaxID=57060 RepID=A0A8J6BFY0_ELECQ|nr:hypothetical protein GDO78_013939 [Eleutherodactylus coqui]
MRIFFSSSIKSFISLSDDSVASTSHFFRNSGFRQRTGGSTGFLKPLGTILCSSYLDNPCISHQHRTYSLYTLVNSLKTVRIEMLVELEV